MRQPHRPAFKLCHPFHTTSRGNTPFIHLGQQTLSTASWIPHIFAWECYPSHCWCKITLHKHTTWRRHRICTTLHEITCQYLNPRCSKSPHNRNTTWNNPEEQQPLIHGQAFSPTRWYSHANQSCPGIRQTFHGCYEQAIWEPFISAIPFWKRFIDDILLIFLGTTKQLQSMKDFINNLHPTIKFTFEHSTQEISFLDMKIHIGTDRKLSITLYRKPIHCAALLQFHSNHSLKWKESIVFSQTLRYNSSLQMMLYCKKNSILSERLTLPDNTL